MVQRGTKLSRSEGMRTNGTAPRSTRTRKHGLAGSRVNRPPTPRFQTCACKNKLEGAVPTRMQPVVPCCSSKRITSALVFW